MRIQKVSASRTSRAWNFVARGVAGCTSVGLHVLLPAMPLLAAVLFLRLDYVLHYMRTMRRMRRHVAAVSQGPLQHYFSDIFGRVRVIPAEIRGSCVQCGNCCMNRQCAFLEPIADGKFQCGIYHSFWRRFSNCGSFPLSQYDIERYACPSYHSVPLQTVSASLGDAVRRRRIADRGS